MTPHPSMPKMNTRCYILTVVIASVIQSTTAARDVTINIRLESHSPPLRYLHFSSENFIQFHECMCHQGNSACNAHYSSLASVPNLYVTSITRETETQNSYSFKCVNEQNNNRMACNQWTGNPNTNNVYQSFLINKSNCSSNCVTFVWINDNENMTIKNETIGIERCSPDQTATTKPPLVTPTHTNSTKSDDDSSTGVIVGVVVAMIIIITIVAVVVGIIFWRRRRPPPKRQSWSNLEASSNNTTSLDDALNYRYRQHPAAAQEDTPNNNLHYDNDSNLQANHSSTDAVKKNNGIVEKHDYTEVDVTSKRGNNIVKGNISASGYDFADVPEEDKPQAKDGGNHVALVPGNKKKADDNGTEEDSDYSVIDDSEDKARQDNRGGSTAAGSTSLYSTAKTDDDFGYSTVKDNNQGKPPANLINTNKNQDNISTPKNTAYSLAGNTETTISKDSNSTTPHIYSTFHDDNSKPQNPYNVLPDADQAPQTEPPLSMPSSNPTNPNIQPSRYSMANPMLDASFDKTAGNSIEIITLPSSASE